MWTSPLDIKTYATNLRTTSRIREMEHHVLCWGYSGLSLATIFPVSLCGLVKDTAD